MILLPVLVFRVGLKEQTDKFKYIQEDSKSYVRS
jgi:hypothetical protein